MPSASARKSAELDHLAIPAWFPDPLGEERKGAICQGSKTEKSVGTERPAGGKATNDGTVPKVRGQARKITCGPATTLESSRKATACTEHKEWQLLRIVFPLTLFFHHSVDDDKPSPFCCLNNLTPKKTIFFEDVQWCLKRQKIDHLAKSAQQTGLPLVAPRQGHDVWACRSLQAGQTCATRDGCGPVGLSKNWIYTQ